MVNFRNLSDLANKAKDAVEKRGGTDALKQDAAQLRSIATGPGTLSEKAKAAGAKLREAGAEMRANTAGAAEAPTSATEPKATDAPKAAPKAKAAGKATGSKTAAKAGGSKRAAAKASTPKQVAGKAKAGAAAKTGNAKAGGRKKPPPDEAMDEGDSFKQVLCLGGQPIDVYWTLTRSDRPKLAEWDADGPKGAGAKVRYVFEASGGGTRFGYENDFDLPGGPVKLIAGRIVGAPARRAAKKSLRKLKQVAEADAAVSTA